MSFYYQAMNEYQNDWIMLCVGDGLIVTFFFLILIDYIQRYPQALYLDFGLSVCQQKRAGPGRANKLILWGLLQIPGGRRLYIS